MSSLKDCEIAWFFFQEDILRYGTDLPQCPYEIYIAIKKFNVG